MSRAFLSLGSNLGDRLGYLRAAADALGRGPRTSFVGASKVYETEPVEVDDGQPYYLNCVVALECGVSAVELLRYCQGVEAALGREKKGEKSPRTVDIDVLLFGDKVVGEPDYILPHPGIGRAFNVVGLADLDPGLYVPGKGKIADVMAGMDLDGVREVGTLC